MGHFSAALRGHYRASSASFGPLFSGAARPSQGFFSVILIPLATFQWCCATITRGVFQGPLGHFLAALRGRHWAFSGSFGPLFSGAARPSQGSSRGILGHFSAPLRCSGHSRAVSGGILATSQRRCAASTGRFQGHFGYFSAALRGHYRAFSGAFSAFCGPEKGLFPKGRGLLFSFSGPRGPRGPEGPEGSFFFARRAFVFFSFIPFFYYFRVKIASAGILLPCRVSSLLSAAFTLPLLLVTAPPRQACRAAPLGQEAPCALDFRCSDTWVRGGGYAAGHVRVKALPFCGGGAAAASAPRVVASSQGRPAEEGSLEKKKAEKSHRARAR